MVLVAYSDSEDSDTEAPQKPTETPKPATSTSASASKPAFQKVVDRSNPHKIRVNLPTLSQPGGTSDDIAAEAPPAKRLRTGGGGGAFSSFNSFLPAPKRAAQTNGASSSTEGVKKGLGKGLGVGINLRTGATPAFSREPVVEDNYTKGDEIGPTGENNSSVKQTDNTTSVSTKIQEEPQEVKLVGKPMMFRPLSVTNKKKKRPASMVTQSTTAQETKAKSHTEPTPPKPVAKPVAKPKVSLFSISNEDSSLPIVPAVDEIEDLASDETLQSEQRGYPDLELNYQNEQVNIQSTSSSAGGGQSLSDIASDLNLTPAARRQLLGRHASKNGNLAAINVVNFNTDKEYAANEALRASGQAAPIHNPVRAIAPGKHNLRQLVNAAVTQKEALEESFAAGKRNKKESGSKYGW